MPLYADHCAACHGTQLQGTDSGVALLGGALRSGDTVRALQQSIKNGHIALGQLDYTDTLSGTEIKGLAIYIGDLKLCHLLWRGVSTVALQRADRSLKGSSLRMVFDGNSLTHCEALIKKLARIRDIEVGYDGLLYVLLESKAVSNTVKLKPADDAPTTALLSKTGVRAAPD